MFPGRRRCHVAFLSKREKNKKWLQFEDWKENSLHKGENWLHGLIDVREGILEFRLDITTPSFNMEVVMML